MCTPDATAVEPVLGDAAAAGTDGVAIRRPSAFAARKAAVDASACLQNFRIAFTMTSPKLCAAAVRACSRRNLVAVGVRPQ